MNVFSVETNTQQTIIIFNPFSAQVQESLRRRFSPWGCSHRPGSTRLHKPYIPGPEDRSQAFYNLATFQKVPYCSSSSSGPSCSSSSSGSSPWHHTLYLYKGSAWRQAGQRSKSDEIFFLNVTKCKSSMMNCWLLFLYNFLLFCISAPPVWDDLAPPLQLKRKGGAAGRLPRRKGELFGTFTTKNI